MDSSIFARDQGFSSSYNLFFRTISSILYVSSGMFGLFVRHTMKEMEKRPFLPFYDKWIAFSSSSKGCWCLFPLRVNLEHLGIFWLVSQGELHYRPCWTLQFFLNHWPLPALQSFELHPRFVSGRAPLCVQSIPFGTWKLFQSRPISSRTWFF